MVGPTATGKSDLALALAEQAQAGGLSEGAEIINADASLLYRGMDIGTAKPSPVERVRVPHHQIDVLSVRDRASVAAFQRAARSDIEGVESRGNLVIIAGGSGLYVRALTDGLDFPGTDPQVRTGLAEHFLPELPALRLERDEHMRHKDVYAHSLTVLEQAIDLEKARGHQPDIVNRLAALLHDIGKPATRRFEGSKVTFHHHDVVGAKLVTKRLKALKYPTATVKSVARLVELHLRFHGYGEASWSDSAVRRYVRDAGDELERLHILTRADCTTRNRNKATRLRRNYEELEWRIDELAAQEEIKAIRPDLDGAQIMEILGIKPGPEVGKAYKFLLNHRMDHGPLPEDEARDLLLTWWKDQQSQG